LWVVWVVSLRDNFLSTLSFSGKKTEVQKTHKIFNPRCQVLKYGRITYPDTTCQNNGTRDIPAYTACMITLLKSAVLTVSWLTTGLDTPRAELLTQNKQPVTS
jgi:hypothetical protein